MILNQIENRNRVTIPISRSNYVVSDMPNPNIVRKSKTLKCLEYACYLILLCTMMPIKIEHRNLEYDRYLEKFNKTQNNSKSYQERVDAFVESLHGINHYNKNRPNNSALYGLTKYSDLSSNDFLTTRLLSNFPNYYLKTIKKIPILNNTLSKNSKVPLKIDWREKNVVNKVQDQGNCGACWAFAVIGIMESMFALKTNKLASFSVQEMIDCAENNNGCNGGDIYLLLDWLKAENITVVSKDEYLNKIVDERCKTVPSRGIQIEDFECGNFVKTEDLIIDLLANYGPVAVAINALSWQNYVSGVIQFHCDSNSLNHAVQIVGYDMSADIPHYIVRNSWGEDFGDNGYLYIAIGGNICGLAEEVCIVEL